MRKTKIFVTRQGQVKFGEYAHTVIGNDDCVCFSIVPSERAFISSSSHGHLIQPEISVLPDSKDSGDITTIEFPEFLGWSIHSWSDGKEIAIALINEKKMFELDRAKWALAEALPHVESSANAEHMLDGFGPRQERPVDDLVRRMKEIIDE